MRDRFAEKRIRSEVMEIFHHRCVRCFEFASDVNEIIPRSRTKNAVYDSVNRVPLCRACHEWYHHDGVTEEKMEELRELALMRLSMFGETYESWKRISNEILSE